MSRMHWLPALVVFATASVGAALWWVAAPEPGASLPSSEPAARVVPSTSVDDRLAPDGALPAPVTGTVETLVVERPVPLEEPARSLRLLVHADDATRLAAAEVLAGYVPGEAEHGLLVAAMTDPCPAVREQSLRALEDAEEVDVIPACTLALRHEDLWVQDAGETVLYRHTDRASTISALAALCADPSRAVRMRAAELLDEMNAGPLAWDELYDGPVRIAWAGLDDTHTPPFGEDR